MKIGGYLLFLLLCTGFSCTTTENNTTITRSNPTLTSLNDAGATAIAVSISGTENNYTFSVTVKSPDLGCTQYADWWEVISEDGKLISRRILLHSHVNEQPFERLVNNVAITKNQIAIIRVHMNTTGYSKHGLIGSVATGFDSIEIATDFAQKLSLQEPLPTNCAF